MANAQPLRSRLEPGAPAAAGMIPLCVPEVRGNEWEYIKDCLDTGWVSSVGSYVDRFERELAAATGNRFAVATGSGTAALHISLLISGVQPDDEVLVSTLTFIAPVNAIRYCNAWPVLVDAEPDYWQMGPAKVTDFLENECRYSDGVLRNKRTGRRVSAVVPVHILGHPCDMDPLREVAAKYDLPVIEDATESLGARYKSQPVGHLGRLACLSFNGNKLITTGGGGAIVTDDEALATRAKYLTTQAKDDPLEYVHNEIGYNYRLTNIQAAMGCAQVELLDSYLEAKLDIAARYRRELEAVPGITLMPQAAWAESAWWLYTILVDESRYGTDSRGLLHRLGDEKIQTRPLWQPAHLSAAHAGSQALGGEVATKLNRDALSLPCSVGLKEADQDRVIAAVKRFAS
jgi:perosamine synthetase